MQLQLSFTPSILSFPIVIDPIPLQDPTKQAMSLASLGGGGFPARAVPTIASASATAPKVFVTRMFVTSTPWRDEGWNVVTNG